jgi:hypothetical protein
MRQIFQATSINASNGPWRAKFGFITRTLGKERGCNRIGSSAQISKAPSLKKLDPTAFSSIMWPKDPERLEISAPSSKAPEN